MASMSQARRSKAQSAGEYIFYVDVFSRDGWRCQVCGASTPLELHNKRLPRSPEVDHIIPICKGGAHTMANVQCLCRDCNIKKRGTLNYQPSGRGETLSRFGLVLKSTP